MSPVEAGSPAEKIALRIREVRLHYNLTQQDFADVLGVTRQHVSDIETCRVEPSLRVIYNIMFIDIALGPIAKPVDGNWLLVGDAFGFQMFGKRPKGFWPKISPGTAKPAPGEAGWYHPAMERFWPPAGQKIEADDPSAG